MNIQSLPSPITFDKQHRIFTEKESPTGNSQNPGIRASNSRWSWLWRSIKYTTEQKQTYYLNRNSAVKYLERNGCGYADQLSNSAILHLLQTSRPAQQPAQESINHAIGIGAGSQPYPNVLTRIAKPHPIIQNTLNSFTALPIPKSPQNPQKTLPYAPPPPVFPEEHLEELTCQDYLAFRMAIESVNCNAELSLPSKLLEDKDIESCEYLQDLFIGKVVIPVKIKNEEHYYVVWQTPKDKVFNIQDLDNFALLSEDNHLGLTINKFGKITSLRIENIDQSPMNLSIPLRFRPQMRACFNKALELSSDYIKEFVEDDDDPNITIKLIKRSLKTVPEYHLTRLVRSLTAEIRTIKDPKIHIRFLQNNLKAAKGLDAGGLARDYFDDLMEGLLNGFLKFQTMPETKLKLPRTQKDCEGSDITPSLDSEEKVLYRSLGKLLMYFFHSESIPARNPRYSQENICISGRHFDDALFRAAFSLEADELNVPFETLGTATMLKMCKALASERSDMSFYNKLISLLQKQNKLSDKELLEAAATAEILDILPEEIDLKDKNGNLEINKVKHHKALIFDLLTTILFTRKGDHGQFGAQLPPLHAIAQGMKSFSNPGHNFSATQLDPYWDQQIMKKNAADFSTKVQGTIDRNLIANSIVLKSNAPNPEMMKKVVWMKEWIRDGAPDSDLRDFLKYVAGPASLPKGKHIKILRQEKPFVPTMKAHSCFFELEMSPSPCGIVEFNDKTKEGFIKCLKASFTNEYNDI